jgi:hypothetical protein
MAKPVEKTIDTMWKIHHECRSLSSVMGFSWLHIFVEQNKPQGFYPKSGEKSS